MPDDRPNWRCPKCGHEMLMEITSTTIDVGLFVFCPADGTAMDRLDPLGALEADHRSDKPETFGEYVKRPEVLKIEARLDE